METATHPLRVTLLPLALLAAVAFAILPSAQTIPESSCTVSAIVPATAQAYQPLTITATVVEDFPQELYLLWCNGETSWPCDGTQAFTQVASPWNYTYRTPGTYNWKVRVSDGFWSPCYTEGTITITASPCQVSCTATIPEATQPYIATYASATATLSACYSTEKYLEIAWGDGQSSLMTADGTFEPHYYQSEGAFDWKMTAYAGPYLTGEARCEKAGAIVVGCGLACKATVPLTGTVGAQVDFAATANKGSCTGTPALSWIFGDGQTSTQQNPSHTYGAAGPYDWTLNVSVDGKTCSKNGTITIAPPECALDCTATVPDAGSVGSPVAFASTGTPTNCTSAPTFAWTFGDEGTSNQQNPSHTYGAAGLYDWKLNVSVDGKTCTKSGSIFITDCTVDCTATAPATSTVGTPVYFTATATAPSCTGDRTFAWVFGDGWTSTVQNPSHAYWRTGTFPWSMTATAEGIPCTKTGSITVGCFKVGQLSFCSDTVSKSGDTYTLSGNVRINDRLYFSDQVTFVGDATGTGGALSSAGLMYVMLASGRKNILDCMGTPLQVDGNAATLTPGEATGAGTFLYSISGMPMYMQSDPITVGGDGVRVQSVFYAGLGQWVGIATFKTTTLFPPGGKMKVEGTQVLSGNITPGIRALQLDLLYNPDTDATSGTLAVGFPFMNLGWSLNAALETGQCGLNRFMIQVGIPGVNYPLGALFQLSNPTLDIQNVCDWSNSGAVFFGGDATWGVPPGKTLPSELFVIKYVGLRYLWPYGLEVRGGPARIIGYDMAGLFGRAKVSPDPYFWIKGNLTVGDVLTGDVGITGVLLSMRLIGRGDVTLNIPNWSCSPTNRACQFIHGLVTSVINLPVSIGNVNVDIKGRYDIIGLNPVGYLDFQGRLKQGPISTAFLIQTGTGAGISFNLGTNYDNMMNILRSETRFTGPHSAEKSLTLPTPVDMIAFEVAGDSLPSIYLRTPQGQTITPANAATFPGVTYFADTEANVALFRVEGVSAGTWVLGEDNLPVEQVAFAAMAPHTDPVTSFTSVTQNGDFVAIAASVTPADPDTMVDLYYSTVADGTVEGIIDENLPATSGSISATWDSGKASSGTYYLIAKTSDGMNPPVMTIYSEPVEVDRGAIHSPTGLTGSRDGGTVSLAWTPSTTQGVEGYQVKYTDDPQIQGYSLLSPADSTTGATVTGLDPAKGYRFCVVAFDADGDFSVESNAVTFPKPGGTPGDCDGDNTVSIGEVQKAINMFLGSLPPGCGVDTSGDGTVSIGEVQKVINAFLGVVPGISVSVTPSTTTVLPGGTQQFAATVTGTTDTAVAWSVQEGAAGGTVSGSGLYTAPAASGTYHILATSQADPSKSDTATVTVLQAPPCTLTCTASATPTSGQAPLAVNFSATATPSNCSGPVTYAWTFGDGGSSSQPISSHTYPTPGTYSWTVTVSVNGVTCSKSGSITVAQEPTCTLTCTASASPTSGQAPLEVNFTATSTATNCSGGVGYAWAFGDGSTSATQNPYKVYASAGTYNWSLTVSAGGQSCSQNGTITVTGGSGDTQLASGVPVAGTIRGAQMNASWNYYYLDVPAGVSAVTVDVNSLSDDVDLYVRSGQKPDLGHYDCRSWEFGTTGEQCSVPLTGPVRAWVGVTNYAVNTDISYTVTATAGGGGCALTCSAMALPTGSRTAQFDGTANASGCTEAPVFLWDFGDGFTSMEQSPTHTYPSAGTYSWSFIVIADNEHCEVAGNVNVSGR